MVTYRCATLCKLRSEQLVLYVLSTSWFKLYEQSLNLSKCVRLYLNHTSDYPNRSVYPCIMQTIFHLYHCSLWFTVILDLVLVLLMGFGCFAVAVTISVGLGITCSNTLSNDKG